MKVRDIRDHVSKLLFSKLSLPIYVEEIGELKQDCISISIADVRRQYLGLNKENLRVSWDIKFIPKLVAGDSYNTKIIDKLDDINLAFDTFGRKTLKVLDRHITILNNTQTIVDKIGHYMFDTDLIVYYGTEYEYELMEILELDLK